jgi:hypothetical protein
MYEGQFSNVSFLAKQILFEISSSQTEAEHAFNVFRVLIALRLPLASGHNMDGIIITIVKDLHDDPCANCKPNFDFNKYLKIELLIEDTYNLIE